MSANPLSLASRQSRTSTGRSTRHFRWITVLIACLTLVSLLGCEELIRHKKRKFGSTCGNSTECESGVCSHGTCTQSCGSDDDCGGDLCIEATCQQSDSDYDGDGLLNNFEKSIGTDPSKKDSDADGIDDGVEVGADTGHPKDSNANGIPDALESNIGDKDQDCIVDAFDKVPNGPDPLPGADGICNQGVCAGAVGKAKVTCVPTSQGSSTVGLPVGCTGCVCEAPGVADWQATESFCDALDNDCDGQTDEGLAWNKLPLGAPCQADKGLCAVSGKGVLQKGGKVECGTDKVATCSTLANGHESLALPETCNGLDDNCDGETDETFLWQGHKVGTSCADTCGGTSLLCDDKVSSIGGAVVRCLDDKTAICSGEPWATGFVQVGQGVPQARAEWNAVLMGNDKVLLFSGKTAATDGIAVRDESWSLEVTPLNQSQSISQPWHHDLPQEGAPGRGHAALVWDDLAQRSLVIGGVTDQWQSSVWSIAPAGAATEVSGLDSGDPLLIPHLYETNPVNEQQWRQTQAVILNGPGGHRSLLVVAPNLAGPMELPLSPTPVVEWKTAPMRDAGVILPTKPIYDAICLTATPDGSAAVLVEADGTTWWIVDDGETPVLHMIANLGEVSAVARQNVQCVIDDAKVLHFFGGEGPGITLRPNLVADLSGIPNDITPTLPNDITWTQDNTTADVLNRAGGFATWHAPSKTIIIGGGWVPVNTASGPHRAAVSDVWAYSPGSGTATRLDTEAPAGRIGAAHGWRSASGQWCIAGGLTYDLPDQTNDYPRAVPVTDAWCVAPTGAWTKVGSDILYAFGIAGIDQAGDRFVLAGGFALTAHEAVPELDRLWTGGLLQVAKGETVATLAPGWAPTKAVRTLDLKTNALQTTPSTGAYGLTASSVAFDPLRNRLVISGGFDDKRETHAFLTLDLATLGWTDVGAKVPSNGFCGGECHPVDRYGAPMVYDPVHDIVGITAGSIRAPDGGLGEDTGVMGDAGCQGFKGNTLWLGTTGVITGTPQFLPSYVPNFADGDLTKPLLQQYFGGPVFVPVLFDWLGGRAWLAPQVRAIPQWGGPNGAECANWSQQAWAASGVQVSLAVGLCQPLNPQSVQAKLEEQNITAPSALIHAAAYFDVATQKAWLFSGMEPDGTVASGLWQLAQVCGK